MSDSTYKSHDYTMYPAGGVEISISMITGSINSQGNTSFTYGTAGKSGDQAPPPSTFTIFGSEPGDNYASCTFTLKDSQYTNTCHVFFDVTGNEFWWQARPYSGDNADPLGQSTDSNFHIGHPAQNSGGGTGGEMYQNLSKAAVFLVDYNVETKSMLFRGNQPLEQGDGVTSTAQRVDFPNLHQYMKDRFESQVEGGVFPEAGTYILHDINIMTMAEKAVFEEKASFDEDTSVIPTSFDENTWYPATGVKIVTKESLDYKGKFYMHSILAAPDQANTVNTFTKLIQTWMDTSPDDDTIHIYYFHCASGHDRTAICAISYLAQKYTDLDLSNAFIYGTTLAGSGATIIDTSTVSNDKTRHFPAEGGGYDQTIVNCYNLLRNDTKTVADLKATKGYSSNPTYVEADYPWEKIVVS